MGHLLAKLGNIDCIFVVCILWFSGKQCCLTKLLGRAFSLLIICTVEISGYSRNIALLSLVEYPPSNAHTVLKENVLSTTCNRGLKWYLQS